MGKSLFDSPYLSSTESFIELLFSKFYKAPEFAVKFGDYKQNLVKYAFPSAPYAKVAVASLNDSFSKIGKELTDFLKANGLKPISFVYSLPLKNTIESVAGFFEYPEDTRLIIVTDDCLLDFAKYFATVKNIPVVFLPTCPSFRGVFSSSVFINTDGNLDCISVKKNTLALIDFSIMGGGLSECFQRAFSRFISVFDYAVDRALRQKKPSEKLLSVYKGLFKSFDFSNLTADSVVGFCLKTEAVISLFGEANNFGADEFCLKLLKKEPSGFSLAVSLLLAKIYAIVGVKSCTRFELEDYCSRAEKVSKILELDFSVILSNLNSQVENFSDNNEYAISSFIKFSESFGEFYIIEEKIKKAYVSLGGNPDFEKKNAKAIKKIFKNLGDTPFLSGGCAVLRELGLLN